MTQEEPGILLPEAGATCAHCGDLSVCRLGKDKVPLCLKHFEIAMEGIAKIIKRLVELAT